MPLRSTGSGRRSATFATCSRALGLRLACSALSTLPRDTDLAALVDDRERHAEVRRHSVEVEVGGGGLGVGLRGDLAGGRDRPVRAELVTRAAAPFEASGTPRGTRRERASSLRAQSAAGTTLRRIAFGSDLMSAVTSSSRRPGDLPVEAVGSHPGQQRERHRRRSRRRPRLPGSKR